MASQARQLATGLMSAALERRPDIGFRSYDRLFPSQDLMPDGGFGNLIALPLQRVARDRGHSVFIDDELNPFLDQWEYLASLKKIEVSVIEHLLAELSSRRHGTTGIPLPISDEASPTPWALPQTSNPDSHVTEPLPKRVPITLADQVYIDRTALPTTMVMRLMRLAAFQNPGPRHRAGSARRCLTFKGNNWSGKRGSNSRPQPWQGCALPTELFPP